MDEDNYTRDTNEDNNNNNEEEGSQQEDEDNEDGDGDGDGDADATNEIEANDHSINASMIVQATPTLASLSDPTRVHQVREMTEAVWSLSTAKPGNGVAQIMDSSPDTYWQSDGPQPHMINIHFHKRKDICEVAFYLDYSLDESYTPKRIGIKSGVTFHDLEEVKVIEMNEPVGWISVPLYAEEDPLDDVDGDGLENDNGGGLGGDDDEKEREKEKERRRKPLRTHFIQICILSMAQNGRDTVRSSEWMNIIYIYGIYIYGIYLLHGTSTAYVDEMACLNSQPPLTISFCTHA